MCLRNKSSLPILKGKVVQNATAGVDDKGYGFVTLEFVDGQELRISEIGQTGEIEWVVKGQKFEFPVTPIKS